MNIICFDKQLIVAVLVVIIIVGCVVYKSSDTYQVDKKNYDNVGGANNFVPNVPAHIQDIDVHVQDVPLMTDIAIPVLNTNPIDEMISEYDYRNIADPLKEPGRRPSRDIIGPMIGSPHFNIPTRGYPDSFSIFGYLVDDFTKDENRIIRLYGRKKFPNSDEFEYYVEINVGNGDDKIKYELHKQRRELYDGDQVYVSLIKRNFKVQLLKQKGLEYNPFLW